MSVLKAFTGPGMFRYFLALTVFLHHLTRFRVGNAAVYVFLVLSGYWIYQMWTAKYIETNRPYVTYCVSRAWRLFPVFWLCSALTIALDPAGVLSGGSGFHYWASQAGIFGYNALPYRPNAPAWSLDVEMQFYVIAPLIAAAFLRVHAGGLVAAIAVVSAAASLYWGECLASCLIFFALGMAASHLRWRPSKRSLKTSIATGALIVGCCLLIPELRSIILVRTIQGPLGWANPYLQIALGLLAIPYAIWTTHQRSSTLDKILADASFTLYLLHWSLFQWTIRHGLASKLLDAALLSAVTVGLSLLLVIYFDAPIQRWRSNWVKGRRSSEYSKSLSSIVSEAPRT
jgi:peptidoglycan/LPS O-acetylase OafA/YrhL